MRNIELKNWDPHALSGLCDEGMYPRIPVDAELHHYGSLTEVVTIDPIESDA